MKTVLFWMWTILVVYGYISVSGSIIQDEVHVGRDLVFSVFNSRDLEINSEGETTIEATSPRYFLFWQSSEEVIVGLPSTEWDRKTDYNAGPTEIQNGRWLLESEGTVKVHLMSSVAVTAKEIETDPFSLYMLMLIPAAIVWLVGMAIGSEVF